MVSDIRFTKMSAGGNDFVVIDNVAPSGGEAVEIDTNLVRRLCSRALSVGADGLIVIEPVGKSGAGHFKMVYFNADGGRSFCGNGVRCVTRLAALKRLAPAEGMKIETDAGVLEAAVKGDRPWFRLSLGRPTIEPVRLLVEEIPGADASVIEATLATAGVPHLVTPVEDAHGMNARKFQRLAPLLRAHPDLGPDGANVDFITVRDRRALDIRCYERGVEGETFSSGTGCIAAALAARHAGLVDSPVDIRSRMGFTSRVTLEGTAETEDGVTAVLSGDARVIYNAILNLEALAGWDL